jgi:hypothetical protein
VDTDSDIAAIMQHITVLEHRITTLEAQIAHQPVMLDGGKLPPMSIITRLECQIFHTPNLSANQRKAKTEWSLRLTVWIADKRAKPDINVRLFGGDRFYQQAMERNPLPETLSNFATKFRGDDTVLLGMLQVATKGHGSPYLADQFCLLRGHQIGAPQVAIVIGEDLLQLDTYRSAKGVKAGHAIWYLDWRP